MTSPATSGNPPAVQGPGETDPGNPDDADPGDAPTTQEPSGAEDLATSEDPAAVAEVAATGAHRGGHKKRKVQEAMGSEDRRYVSSTHTTLKTKSLFHSGKKGRQVRSAQNAEAGPR
jgi:hypothetical protein